MLRQLLIGSALACALAAPNGVSAQQDVSGPYLAARMAGFTSDYGEAAQYYDRFVDQAADQPYILESAMVVFAVLQDFERAAEIARLAKENGAAEQLADLMLLIDDLRGERFDAAKARLEAGPVTGPLLDGLLLGWVEVALGRMSAALDAFDALAEQGAFAEFAYIHRAFALAQVGDFEGAEAILSGEEYGPPRLGTVGIVAHAQMLAQLERRDDAVALLEATITQRPVPELIDLRDRIAAGDAVPYTIATTPLAGMSDAFHMLAAVVNGDASESYVLIHSQAALALDPTNVDAALLTADVLDSQQQYRLAEEVLATVPAEHPAYIDATVARAEILYADGQKAEATAMLQDLAQAHPENRRVWSSLGDIHRRESTFEEARSAYSRAIDLIEDPDEPNNWFLYYTRAIANERTGRWDEAAADFDAALALNAEQPLVLNYYGYSLVERRERLDEALDMIQRAVAGRPQDGFITDSLGWVYYRLGRYDEAVEPMETAVRLEPLDPVINDHLGDVYWKVGRKREAEFQWRRALSFVPEPNDSEADPERIRRKLEVGLDAVLQEEQAKGGETQ